jgi:hypothetical protein
MRKSHELPEFLSLFHIQYYQIALPYLPRRFIFDQFFIAILSTYWRMNPMVKDVTNAAIKLEISASRNRAK